MSTGWTVGLILGVVVILVAALIVIRIVLLAQRIAEQAAPPSRASAPCAQQTTKLNDIGRINDSGVRILHSRPRAAEGGGGQMTNDDAWTLALIIGLVAALIVAGAAAAPDQGRARHRELGRRPARGRDERGRQHRQHPAAAGHRAVLGQIVDEAVVQDGYMNALTDGYGVKV